MCLYVNTLGQKTSAISAAGAACSWRNCVHLLQRNRSEAAGVLNLGAQQSPTWYNGMAVSDRILTYPEPVLRQKAQSVKRISAETRALIETMTRLASGQNGVGLAANQVGVAQRVIVLQTENGMVGLVNPRIEKASGEQVGPEGCLSLPNLYGMVRRSEKVTVRGLDSSGKARKITGEGMLARAIEHEIDHLNGVLFTDRAEADSLYWLVQGDNGESYQQPTALEQALKVFELRSLARV